MRRFFTTQNILIGVAVVCFVGIAALGSMIQALQSRTTTQKSASTTPTPTPSLSPTPVRPTPTPTPISSRAKLEEALRASVSKTANGNQPKIRNLDVREASGGRYDVDVAINGNDNFTKGMIKTGVWSDVSRLYAAAYKQSAGLAHDMAVTAYMPLTDKFGNENDGVVLKTSLDQATAEKVNWNQGDAQLALRILPAVSVVEMNRLD